jgi:proline-specific peptidase
MCGKGAQTYEVMWGPSEFQGLGSLRCWDVTDRLSQVAVPTLIASGCHDEATPAQAERLLAIPGSRQVVFEKSAHLAFLEEPDRFAAAVEEFLSRQEGTVV